MAWKFLHLRRNVFKGDDNWGKMFIRNTNDEWEKLCYTYELPWKENRKGKSKKFISRIKIGEYEMKERKKGNKGWRLELLGTGHRTEIQVHRAHSSMYIEGCILPVTFSNYNNPDGLKKGNAEIQSGSVLLMKKIKNRYEELAKKSSGNPTILISAIFPPKISYIESIA